MCPGSTKKYGRVCDMMVTYCHIATTRSQLVKPEVATLMGKIECKPYPWALEFHFQKTVDAGEKKTAWKIKHQSCHEAD